MIPDFKKVYFEHSSLPPSSRELTTSKYCTALQTSGHTPRISSLQTSHTIRQNWNTKNTLIRAIKMVSQEPIDSLTRSNRGDYARKGIMKVACLIESLSKENLFRSNHLEADSRPEKVECPLCLHWWRDGFFLNVYLHVSLLSFIVASR